MKNRNYINERDLLLNASTLNKVPSRAFIGEFKKRLLDHIPSGQPGYASTNGDFYRQGFALYGTYTNAQVQMGVLQLELWEDFYEAKDNHSRQGMISALEELMD